ncbi:MAG TPA: ABC transporter permease [Dehalococcoidia bacterium]|nr:ABC transporter permease [Dehalococcoidia bacterium]
MLFLISVWQVVTKRIISNWRLLSTVLAGVIVAVALLSSAPLYSNAINDLGLEHSLQNRAINLLDLQFYAPNYYVDRDEFQETSELISGKIPKNLREVIHQEETWIQTQSFDFFYTDRPTPGGPYQPTGYFHVFSNLDKHVTIADGRLAEYSDPELSQGGIDSPDFAIEGMIGSETAEILNVKVGDRFRFRSGFGATEKNITVELTALIDPIDPADEFWFLNPYVFTLPLVDAEGNSVPPRAPVFISEESLFNIVPHFFPEGRADYNWFYYIDIDNIHSGNADTVKNDIRHMEREIAQELPRSGLLTTLDGLISEYTGRLMFTQIPLFLIVFQVAAIIIFYLVMVSNMLIERQAGEISMYRSRGAGTWHIFLIYLSEGLLICVTGTVIGTALGAFIFSLLGKTASFQSLTGGEMIPVRFSGTVLILIISAAVLCLLALIIPAIQASRRGIVHEKQASSRPSRTPFWQRFYLDIVLLIIGGSLYWELEERGSLVNMDIFGGLGMDPLLLLTPILLLLAVAIIFLRVFPLLLRLAARISRYYGNAPLTLGLWHMARSPVRYARPILLLLVATSVGMFSSGFIGSLEQSYDERNIYMSGGDVRLEELNERHSSKQTLEDRYSAIKGVENVGVAFRQKCTAGTAFTSNEFDMLAIDPDRTKDIAWFRKDFDEKTLPELMDILAEDGPLKEGLEIPDEAETLGLWVYSRLGNPEIAVYARIKDGRGRYMEVNLGKTDPATGGWQYMKAPLTFAGSSEYLPPPLRLSSLYIRATSSGISDVIFQEVCFDNLQLEGITLPEPTIIEDFEDIKEWLVSPDEKSELVTGFENRSGSVETDGYSVHDGQTSAKLRWNVRNTNIVGIYPYPDDRPISVLASRSFVERNGISENDVIRISFSGYHLYVSVTEIIDYFPSLDPDSGGFIIANIDRLFNARNRQPGNSIYPNEVWLDLPDDSTQRDSVLDSIRGTTLNAKNIYDREAMIADMKDDPLAGAAWKGVLLIALLGVVLISSLGFLVYSYLSAQARQLDFAVLRAIGFSQKQIFGFLAFEQLVIIILGLALGAITGERLSTIMMPFLQLTEQGSKVLPPFVLGIDWVTIGITYSILLVAFIITSFLLILSFSRSKIHEILRMGDI